MAKAGVTECLNHNLIQDLPVFCDKKGALVAQEMCTIAILPKSVTVLSGGNTFNKALFTTEAVCEDKDVQQLISMDMWAKEDKKKKWLNLANATLWEHGAYARTALVRFSTPFLYNKLFTHTYILILQPILIIQSCYNQFKLFNYIKIQNNNNMSTGQTTGKLESEKSKDVRATNIIAAKGKYLNLLLSESNFDFVLISCRRCRPYFSRTQRNG